LKRTESFWLVEGRVFKKNQKAKKKNNNQIKLTYHFAMLGKARQIAALEEASRRSRVVPRVSKNYQRKMYRGYGSDKKVSILSFFLPQRCRSKLFFKLF
jgi:hypothetical protein